MRKKIFIISCCKNESGNVTELYARINSLFESKLSHLDYELLFADNASTDSTVSEIKAICSRDKRVKLIVNMRDFGTNKSGHHALMQADGDAIVGIASDLEDPPEAIAQFVEHWENGWPIVLAQKATSNESRAFFLVRTLYYKLLNRLSDVKFFEHATGFGLYDRRVIEEIKKINDPHAYFRGLICELGFDIKLVPFNQVKRTRGVTKNNFWSLVDIAISAVTRHSRVPLRLATVAGVFTGFASLLVGAIYLLYKLVFWETFAVGIGPMVIGMFFLSGVQLVFIGVIGEYLGTLYSLVEKKPTVIERERVNFE
jgi:glycosyltransferase involved in cell wall biosynthesis